MVEVHERETVVVDRPSSSSPIGIIVGILVVALIILGLLWMFGGLGGGSGSVDVDVPAVNVDVVPDGQ